jgi:DNA (cytosine-5)-methyltransferase 1
MALRPRLLSLCAGVGGLDLGVRLAELAARSVCYVEREAAAASILVARMEDGWLHPAPIWSDLATFDAGAWRGAVDCVVSGDPCQPNSVAGRGLGVDDDRWLLDRVIDIFAASGARRLFRENVPGNADGQLGVLVPALEGLGCRVAVGLFSAKELGFAHGRERLFVMADRDGEHGRVQPAGRHDQAEAERGGSPLADAEQPAIRGGGPRPVARAAGRSEGQGHERKRLRLAAGERGADLGPRSVADAGDPRLQGFELRGSCGDERHRPDARVPLLAPGPADQRWPDIIARTPHLEPAVRRVAHGMADRVDRLRACGNGVVPLVAGYAWRTLEARLAADASDSVVRIAA